MAERACKGCEFAVASGGPVEGYFCRRYPQTIVVYNHPDVGTQFEQHWPWMDPGAWCGEYRERHQ